MADCLGADSSTTYFRTTNTLEAAKAINCGEAGAKEAICLIVSRDQYVCAAARALSQLKQQSDRWGSIAGRRRMCASTAALSLTDVMVRL